MAASIETNMNNIIYVYLYIVGVISKVYVKNFKYLLDFIRLVYCLSFVLDVNLFCNKEENS